MSSELGIGVVGAGAMGSGIALVAARHGHEVVLSDARADAIARARAAIRSGVDRDVAKGRLSADEAEAVVRRIAFVLPVGDDWMKAYATSNVVIEAVAEELAVKRDVFARLEAVLADDAVLATNTSSLSVTAIAAGCRQPERVVGLHFFNPAPVMPLVEVVPGLATHGDVVSAARALADGWGKTTVLASDTPGFIVNRVARPYYGEALRILEERVADVATIDAAMRERGGFRMGPFEVMDLVGNDVNYAVTRSVFEGLHYDPRYRPSVIQRRLVDAGHLGRKAGRGYYDYADGATRPTPLADPVVAEVIFWRILVMLINEAADAVLFGVASPVDIDLAVTRGVNYPRGLLAWADELGLDAVLARLVALHEEYGEDRYRPSALLRRLVRTGRRFHSVG